MPNASPNATPALKAFKSAAHRTPTGRPSKRHATSKSSETRSAIIAATLRCFHRDGYFRTNMSTVAKEANVTRGCMQYYFPSTEALLEAAAEQLVEHLFGSMTRAAHNAPPGANLLEHHIDMALNAAHSRQYQILIELMAAARTEPMLRPILARVMLVFDHLRMQLSHELFGDEGKAHLPHYRAAADLVTIMAAGSTIFILPQNSRARLEALREPLKDQVFKLWDVPRKKR
ncbi:MAG: TetR/AcrR family transcriptional regulator [Hyphomonadaceae bacterium]|nr:TetR/AcrR family transcriptional regulator [Hyphomonadaceae bacterium]